MFKIFSFKDLDQHYTVEICGLKLSIRHKVHFPYKKATEYGVTKEKRTPQIIVSLTSFPARINTTHLAINTLLRQNLKPDRVILYLAETQFPNREKDLPQEILSLIDLGLEIRWCDKDIRSYKKLLPALKEFPNDIIVTTDDDIYYDEDWLESLYNKYKQNTESIIAQRVRRLDLKDDKIKVVSMRLVENIKFEKPSYLNQMLGGAGVLYPPHSLSLGVLNSDKAMELLPTNDDIWFWGMAVLNHTKVMVADGLNRDLYQMDLKESSLGKINQDLEINQGKDPFVIICNDYPQIKSILEEEERYYA